MKINILLSYAFADDGIIQALSDLPRDSFRLMIDSGAFSSFNSGKKISVSDYCKFLDKISHLRPFHAVQLDVIGDQISTKRNYNVMRDKGYEVMPVFTRGGPIEEALCMANDGEYFLLGGVAKVKNAQKYVEWFSQKCNSRNIHWLGFCRSEHMKFYRPRSCDSSSWSMRSQKFGSLSLGIKSGVNKTIKTLESFVENKKAIEPILRSNDIVWNDFVSSLKFESSYRYKEKYTCLKDAVCQKDSVIVCLQAFNEVLRSRQIERGIGVIQYAAIDRKQHVHLLSEARNKILEGDIA